MYLSHINKLNSKFSVASKLGDEYYQFNIINKNCEELDDSKCSRYSTCKKFGKFTYPKNPIHAILKLKGDDFSDLETENRSFQSISERRELDMHLNRLTEEQIPYEYLRIGEDIKNILLHIVNAWLGKEDNLNFEYPQFTNNIIRIIVDEFSKIARRENS